MFGDGKGRSLEGSFQQTLPLLSFTRLSISGLSKQIITPVRAAVSCQSSVFSLPCNCSQLNPFKLSLQLRLCPFLSLSLHHMRLYSYTEKWCTEENTAIRQLFACSFGD